MEANIDIDTDAEQVPTKNAPNGYSDFAKYVVQNLKVSQTDEKETPKAPSILTPISLLRSGINKHHEEKRSDANTSENLDERMNKELENRITLNLYQILETPNGELTKNSSWQRSSFNIADTATRNYDKLGNGCPLKTSQDMGVTTDFSGTVTNLNPSTYVGENANVPRVQLIPSEDTETDLARNSSTKLNKVDEESSVQLPYNDSQSSEDAVPEKKMKRKCFTCEKKLGLLGIDCRCQKHIEVVPRKCNSLDTKPQERLLPRQKIVNLPPQKLNLWKKYTPSAQNCLCKWGK